MPIRSNKNAANFVDDLFSPSAEGNDGDKTPLLGKNGRLNAKRKEPAFWWKAAVIFVGVVSASILILALTSCIMQFVAYNRVHTIDSETEEPRKDTLTRYTAAFLVSGPVQPPALLFTGAALAYLPARAADSRRKFGSVSTWEIIIFSVLLVLSFLSLAWPGFWYMDYELRTEADELHSAATEEWDWSPEGSVPYAIHWFTSPLSSYVRGSNIYILLATFVQFAVFVTVRVFQQRDSGYSDKETDEAGDPLARNDGISKGRKLIVALFNILTALLVLGALSYIALLVATVYTNAVSDDQIYWMMFNSSVHVSLSFFVIGWLVFMALTSGWWSYPAHTPTEFNVSVVTALVTLVASGLAAGFGVVHVLAAAENCETTIFSVVEGDTELKIGVCNLIHEERTEHSVVHFWHRFNAWYLLIGMGCVAVMSFISLVVRPQQKYTKKTKDAAKSSGSEPEREEEDEEAYFTPAQRGFAVSKRAALKPSAEQVMKDMLS